MKKYLLLLVLFSLLLCVVSCGEEQTTPPPTSTTAQSTTATSTTAGSTATSTTTPPPPAKTVYDVLSALAQVPYSAVSIAISTTSGGITLLSRYHCTEAEVAYSVEQLAKLPTDGNLDNLSLSDKITLSGTAKRESGKPTYIDAIGVTIPTCTQLATGFDISPRQFSGVSEEEGKFSAVLTSPQDFLGTDVEILSATIQIIYTPAAISSITLSYTTPTSTVTVVYTFTV